jgi:hypothetical protein
MAMATWCHFCGYEDRWVWPAILHRTPGVTVDLVDVSPAGGIANPGPFRPPFSGTDGSGRPTTETGMERALRTYVQVYHLPPRMHAYVAQHPRQAPWNVAAFPTVWAINAHGTVVAHHVGALTRSAMQAWIDQALRRK